MSEQTITDRALQFLKPILPPRFRGDVPIVPIVRLSGIIGISSPLRPGLTLSGTARTLDRAFKTRHARAVALLINSPGGSAVQSHLIFKRIRQLSEENELPVIAFVEDVAASGGYMIACAADEIIADTTSIVGSIGVVGGSFGFDKLLQKIGVERRLYTSGEHKAMLDPFLPEKPDDVQRLKAIQDEIHKFFIELVRERRGAVLIGPEDQLYSGEFWTGARGRELGLVDHIGDIRSTLRERFGDDVLMPLVAADRTPFWRRRLGFEAEGRLGFEAEGMGLASDLISALEARAVWARFGL